MFDIKKIRDEFLSKLKEDIDLDKINQIKSYTVVSKSSDKKQCFLLSTQHPEYTFYCPLLSGQETQGENGDELTIDPKIEKEKFITQPSGLGFSY